MRKLSDIVKTKRRKTALLALGLLAVLVPMAAAQLNVSISQSGTIKGAVAFKELTISAQGAVNVLGTATVMPACATALAASFVDTPTANLNWGTSLSPNSDDETFFCVGNIGNVGGVVHVSISGTDASTFTVEQCQQGLVGLTFSALEGSSIGAGGVLAVRVHLHTSDPGIGGTTNLSDKINLSIS